ncbi:dephospho-CoA kinase [Streptococcus sp. DD13]|uniref:dephospho-CoA kinase n=1 Tax=Streptococcus sp. DD13 TaxID=1777881 RepID=UPI0007934D4A|nr:dephospho-CoA kinase [Streptococcus sp. DD13]KXT78358.1 Dephospho-CoA kinase [Streptococcus sp. DD13]
MIIGLTGGIASGKSTVTNYLREQGFTVIDADALVHELQQPGGRLYQLLLEHFGASILSEDGSLNRSVLSQKIFCDDRERNWSDRTQGDIIRQELNRKKEALAQTISIVFMDIPLLYEQNYEEWFDQVWVVKVDASTQLERLMQRNHLTLVEAKQRIEAQLSMKEKARRATATIDNSGNWLETKIQLDDLIQGLKQAEEGKSDLG